MADAPATELRMAVRTSNDSTDSPQSTTSLSALWSSEYGRVNGSRGRIDLCGRWRRNEVDPVIPADWQNAASFKFKLPHPITLSQDVLNFLSKRKPKVRRPPLGVGPVADRMSDHLEQWSQGIIDAERVSAEEVWPAILSASIDLGEFGVLVVPRPAHYADLLTFGSEYNDDGRVEQIAPLFQRDSKGNAPDPNVMSREPWEVHHGQSRKAYEEYLQDAKARRIPFVVRILHPSTCIPLGVGASGKVDALLVRTERTALSLQRDGITFRTVSPEGDARPGINGQTGTRLSAGAVYQLYELWEPGRVTYQVGGRDGGAVYPTWLGGRTDAEIDLAAEFGLTEIPGGYFYGAHWPSESDPDRKGLPFLYPFLDLINGVNQMGTAEVAHAYNVAFGGWFIEPDAEVAAKFPDAWTEDGKPRTVRIEPMKAQYVVGHPVPAVHPGTNKDPATITQRNMALLDSLSPMHGAQPNAEAGGFGQGVAMASVETMLSQITDGALAAYRMVAELNLQIGTILAEKMGRPIPVYLRSSVAKGSRVKALLELKADQAQNDWTLEVFQPTKRGQNLPLAQAGSGWVREKLISHREWLEEQYGAEQPEDMLDEIASETMLDSPQGQQYQFQLAAQIRGDEELKNLFKLQQEGQVSPGGLPAAAIPQRPAIGPTGGDAGGPAGGPNTGNPAQAALAGVVSGASNTGAQARVIAATGAPVATSYR